MQSTCTKQRIVALIFDNQTVLDIAYELPTSECHYRNQTLSMGCYNNCSARGQCLKGICMCELHTFGYDCSESTGFMFVYSPDASLGLSQMRQKHLRSDPIYHSEFHFAERLMNDWSVRTLDRARASFFYVPTWAYYSINNVAFANLQYSRLNRWLDVHNYAENLRNRVFFFTGDKGACHAHRGPIYMSHWGLQVPWEFMKEPETWTGTEAPCSDRRDIIVPMYFSHVFIPQLRDTHYDCEVFFAGSIGSSHSLYSQGVRYELWKHFANDTSFCIRKGRASNDHFARSRFCAVVSGDGFGSRLFHAAKYNCVPLLMQPFVLQPFHDLLPYHLFSVNISHRSEIPNLKETLATIDEQSHARMRTEWHKWRVALDWKQEAYSFARYSLCLRANMDCEHLMPPLLRQTTL